MPRYQLMIRPFSLNFLKIVKSAATQKPATRTHAFFSS